MTIRGRHLLIAAVTASLLLPATGVDAATGKRARFTVHPKYHWRGYGFLPGYRPSPAESQGVPIYGPEPRHREVRYFDYYGNARYGWGRPGFYRGRYNGGSFGPCWTYTPIGMMPTCGQ